MLCCTEAEAQCVTLQSDASTLCFSSLFHSMHCAEKGTCLIKVADTSVLAVSMRSHTGNAWQKYVAQPTSGGALSGGAKQPAEH